MAAFEAWEAAADAFHDRMLRVMAGEQIDREETMRDAAELDRLHAAWAEQSEKLRALDEVAGAPSYCGFLFEERAMKHDGLLEHEGYYIHIFTEPGQDGWTAWATFERKSDFDEQRALIRAVRHRVMNTYETREEAAAAARAYGKETIDAGSVGL